MLLFDDDDELPLTPAAGERTLAAQLGADGLRVIDATLQRQTRKSWLKVARVVSDALRAGGFPPADESHIELHVRRLIGLVEAGALEGQGNLRRPRWSEVRLAGVNGLMTCRPAKGFKLRATRPVAAVATALLVAYPLIAYVTIYIPFIVPRLGDWRAIPAWIKVLLAAPYVAIVLTNGELGGWGALFVRSVLGAVSLVAWQEVGSWIGSEAVSHPDISSPDVVAMRIAALSVAYAAVMATGRALGLCRRVAEER